MSPSRGRRVHLETGLDFILHVPGQDAAITRPPVDRSPLPTRLTRKNGSSPLAACLNAEKRAKNTAASYTRSKSPPSPVNVYISENFSVRLGQFFKLQKLIHNNAAAGIVHTDFDPFKKMDKMTLSAAAQKIRDVPNAGGNSIVSEVLSFELLKRCFGATLLKVLF